MLESFLTFSIVVSLLYDEWIGISPSGIITPGYLALFIDQPHKIFYTLIIAIATALILGYIGDKLFLYGKRQFVAAILIAFVLRTIISSVLAYVFDGTILLTSIGMIIPGLMAHEMKKQGIWITLLHTGSLTSVLYLVLLLFQGKVIF
ncbi:MULTISPECIES: poly-gamma-glutamate biosynthesis protein PgsC [unclassified Fusibacter]|uniref:poly-gamma-glutamate biosynthesis protein PgsC n=1 Tax=unclassified Fusibacter TaxID=2624464 RepID=UPI001010C3EB|nr:MULTISPECIES: poly-gamma-glutamate biosynthesis protein PgsC [unclassified Fusibacter]MCK8061073.1 poly-gamma-glutamate biosynthesis protein PgsC [Fusibacter sp. A2]NPE20473.1 poly-gamma-glutamate biosynthesis protein PgsC [Fusibacter sp. A1]RXV63677.1 poly-gamma-glutamate biosynthesis protein PgsC [Fusibacter sp. A1]